ncbi:unnamed protein product, partial [Brassica rapa]
MQSFLKPPWPGDYKIASVLNLLLLKSITAACVQSMVYQGYKGTDVNLSPQWLIRLFGCWMMRKPSGQQRVSVSMSGWGKQKTIWSLYRSQKWSSIESTLIQITWIQTNWYRVDVTKHVPDTMGFYCSIWKKNKMPKWHTY